MEVLNKEGIKPVGYFFNPNIHPFREYERRVEALGTVAEKYHLPVIWDKKGYDLDSWFTAIGENRNVHKRCPECYRIRLEAAAQQSLKQEIETFTTTLLYSRYQRHELITEMGREIAHRHGLKFWYHDFRQGWQKGIDMAIDSGIYRQPYCGCLFSERERYKKREKRLAQSLSDTQGG